jgi:hypothetical protein
MPQDCDYMDVPEPSVSLLNPGLNPQFNNPILSSTRLPTTSSITLSMQPVYSRYSQSQVFSLNQFAAGALINNPAGSLPGSAFGSGSSNVTGGFI